MTETQIKYLQAQKMIMDTILASFKEPTFDEVEENKLRKEDSEWKKEKSW